MLNGELDKGGKFPSINFFFYGGQKAPPTKLSSNSEAAITNADIHVCLLLKIKALLLLNPYIAFLCHGTILPLKRQTKITADDNLIFYFYLSKKIRLDSLETSSLIFWS